MGILGVDAAIGFTRPAWAWVGQLGLIALGVHLVADRLDDPIHRLLLAAPIPWASPDQAALPAVFVAVAVEIVVLLRAAAAILLTPHEPALSLEAWRANWSVDAIVLPLFWLPVALAGSWIVGLAVEDALAPWVPAAAWWIGAAVAGLIAWRFGWSGWKRAVAGLDPPKRRTEGLFWALPLLMVGAAAARFGLPIWGFLP